MHRNLKALRDLDDYQVESGDPDPRGWDVMNSSGETIGTVDDLIVDTSTMKVRYFLVDRRGHHRATDQAPVIVDAAQAEVHAKNRRVLAHQTSSIEQFGAGIEHSREATSGYNKRAEPLRARRG